jgi:flavin-dependent dehydrogenase
MKVAIAGAGVAGSYLHLLLKRRGLKVDLYDTPKKTACTISPCAWMTASELRPLLENVGLSADPYILESFKTLEGPGKSGTADLMTIDKPRLLRDLRMGAMMRTGEVGLERYERVIDATGTSRAYLPPVRDDTITRCVQIRVDCRDRKFRIPSVRIVEGGYAWAFPLGGSMVHIGCCSYTRDPADELGRSRFLKEVEGMTLCGCTGSVRLMAPPYMRPFVSSEGKVWGVGESIGCVSPLIGEGIIPSMKSALLLAHHWDDPAGYTEAILREFSPYERLHRVQEKLKQGKKPGFFDLLVLRRAMMRYGIRLGVAKGMGILLGLRRGGITPER